MFAIRPKAVSRVTARSVQYVKYKIAFKLETGCQTDCLFQGLLY